MDHHVAGISCADPEGGQDSPSLKNHKNIGFLCNTGEAPMKNHKATKPASKGVRAFRGYFGPLYSQKLKIVVHQFILIGLLDE